MTTALADDDVPHVAEVCRMVQGLPLGIELAAAWVKSLSCREIAEELRASLDFLESGSRTVGERQRSLRAAFDASWTLLTPDQQRPLAALSVFRGGFTKEAAKAVTGADVRQLLALADKALLEMPAAGRYDLHPIVHRFAAERLAGRPDDDARLRDDHGRYFHQLLQAREEELAGRGHREALAALATDEGNLRVAWWWAVAGAHVEFLLASARPLEALFDVKGRYREVAKLFGEAVAGIDGAEQSLGEYEASRQRLVEALALHGEALGLMREFGDEYRQAHVLTSMAASHVALGAFAEAAANLRDSVRLASANGDLPTLLLGVRGLAGWHAAQGRVADAVTLATMVEQHPAAEQAAVDANAAAIAAWTERLAPAEVAQARARGAGLELGDVVAESLRELGTAAGTSSSDATTG
ncbi:MAG: hypothetical protein K0A98_11825 [Trueperaceae bacterium]|nr:hypothetical protein [Trueperaceae bacterium]